MGATSAGHTDPIDPAASSLGAQLRAFRVRAGLSREALAERAGLGLTTLKALEGDRRPRPHPDTLARLAAALGLASAERDALLALASAVPVSPTEAGESPVLGAVGPSAKLVRLPVPPTALIGREAEVAQASTLLAPGAPGTRLLVLLGPGGVGKTRVAVAVGASLVDAYPDGVVFVDLAPLHDGRLVPATIARMLGVREAGAQSARELLLDFLRDKQLALVLDNFEHLLGAAPLLAELLEACSRVALLVTSRAALRLRAERRIPIGPLATPADDLASVAGVAASPAVRLFVERAQAVAPDLVLSAANAPAVAAICRRLDGLPLAIELAAARVGLLRPEALRRRLEHRLPLLTGGPADLPERQQTLRQTLAWSHDLLGPAEQVLFRRLAVFAGGWTLEAAEAVCADAKLPAEAVLDELQALVDSSLVQHLDDGRDESRFGLLETVREYAAECLEAAGEAEDWRRRHATYFLSLAEAAEPELYTAEQVDWLNRLEQDHANLRTVLDWALRTGTIDVALRLSAALRFFWSSRGYFHEGCDWLMASLEHPAAGTPSLARARALTAAATLRSAHSEPTEGRRLLAEGLALGRKLGDSATVALTLRWLGIVAMADGDTRTARAYLEESLAVARQTGARPDIAITLMYLADAVQRLGEHDTAEVLYRESADLLRALGNAIILPYPLRRLGYLALRRADSAPAARLFAESLRLNRHVGERRGFAASLVGLADVACLAGAFDRAARLLGAADAQLADLHVRLPEFDRESHAQTTARVGACLGPTTFADAHRRGGALALEEVLALVQAEPVLASPERPTPH